MKSPCLRNIYLCSFFLSIVFLSNSCKKTATTADVVTIPVVITTSTILDVTSTSAQSGGVISSLGNGGLTANGVCYSSTNTTPTTANAKTSDPIATNQYSYPPFTSNLTNLTPNTTY